MSSANPSVLIVILNYGTYENTLDMIGEIREKLDYDNYSIMVVDNCSPNESAQVLEKKSKEMDYIFYANTVNSGYAAGNNIGIRYGIEHGFDYSWILNNDVLIRERNVLYEMVQKAQSDPRIGSIGPKIYSSNDKEVAPFCNRPTFADFTFGVKRERKYRQTQTDVSREVYCVHGCCVLLSNAAMKDVDCMDERTFLYGEENILAERLRAKGYVSFYLPEVSVKHNEGTTISNMSRNKLKLLVKERKKSRELYLKEYRHFSAPARWLCHLSRAMISYMRNIT